MKAREDAGEDHSPVFRSAGLDGNVLYLECNFGVYSGHWPRSGT